MTETLRAPAAGRTVAPFRVLVADDDVDTCGHVVRLLAPFAEVDAVANGRAALEALGARSYDLVLADVAMQGPGGFELVREVRVSREWKSLPVLLLSARASEEERATGLSAGADDYLAKPFVARDLVARIVSALSRARARAAATLEEVERRVTQRTAELARATGELQESAVERDALRRHLAEAEEAERRRLARELHDQLGQQLTAFSLGLEDAERLASNGNASRAESTEPLLRRLGQLKALAGRMAKGARYLALELRPPELDDVGLASAVKTYVAEWAARYGVEADVAAASLGNSAAADAPDSWIPSDVASALYRIVQEAMTNVARHAAAAHVSVILERLPGEVRVIVEDNGCGFDLDAALERPRAERRLGLAGMRERAALVGGTVAIESSAGNGTTVYVRLPIDHGRVQAPNEPSVHGGSQ